MLDTRNDSHEKQGNWEEIMDRKEIQEGDSMLSALKQYTNSGNVRIKDFQTSVMLETGKDREQ